MFNMATEDTSTETYDQQEEDDIEKDPSLHSFTIGSGCSRPNAVKWSLDGRISILTDSHIYILTITNSNKRRKAGSGFGFVFETAIISQIALSTKVGIDTTNFYDRSLDTFQQRQAYVLDHSTLENRELYTDPDVYCVMQWSPLGCTVDGRSILATLAVNGEVNVHLPSSFVGKWEVVFNVSVELQSYLESNNWFQVEQFLDKEISATKLEKDKENQHMINKMNEYLRRKHLMFTTCISWCPMMWCCTLCLKNQMPENIYYTSYFLNYACCCHSNTMLCTLSKNGYMFLWKLTLNKTDSNVSQLKLMQTFETEIYWPISVSWHQERCEKAFVAVGFSNGLIKVYHFEVSHENEEFSFQFKQCLEVWREEDSLAVNNLSWIQSKDLLHLVASKGTDILVIKDIKVNNSLLVYSSHEVAPSCHTSPLTSLQCIKDRFVVTSSNGATQYFDIENEVLPFCDNTVLRGFRCLGISADPNLSMFVRVSCPSRLLLLQPAFVKQMEVSFLPFLSTEEIAGLVLDGTLHFDLTLREYFLVSSAENFILPNILHKYVDEPESYDVSTKELQLYLYFNQIRYMQQTGLRVNALTKEEIDSNSLASLGEINDSIVDKIETTINLHFFREMLEKFLLLLQNGWIEKTDKGVLSLLLISDWLTIADTSTNGLDLPMKCFEFLQEVECLEKLKILIDKPGVSTNSCSETAKDGEQKVSEKEEVKRNWELVREKCPFCLVPVSLTTLSSSNCSNGHLLQRCALTLQVFRPVKYRFCFGCSRKVHSKKLDGKLSVESILLNTDICPFCGCRLVEAVV